MIIMKISSYAEWRSVLHVEAFRISTNQQTNDFFLNVGSVEKTQRERQTDT